MKLMHKILYKISAYLRCRVICGPEKQAYLERYHVMNLPFGIHIYLHRFIASDPGRALHNHPWRAAFSLVLCGRYHETRLISKNNESRLSKRKLAAGSVNFISGKIYHRINLTPGEEAWTLFIHTARHRSWGFLETRHRQFSYTDHNDQLSVISNPSWWKTATRPRHQPDMREQSSY